MKTLRKKLWNRMIAITYFGLNLLKMHWMWTWLKMRFSSGNFFQHGESLCIKIYYDMIVVCFISYVISYFKVPKRNLFTFFQGIFRTRFFFSWKTELRIFQNSVLLIIQTSSRNFWNVYFKFGKLLGQFIPQRRLHGMLIKRNVLQMHLR